MSSLRIRTIVLSISLLAMSVMSVVPHSVNAIESFGVGAVPANPRIDNKRSQSIFVHELDPNESIKDAVRVVNNTDQEKTIAVYPVDSQQASDGAFACAQAADPKKNVGNWIKLEKEQLVLPAHTMETISFTITAPKDASVGEHNGCIAIQDLKRNEANSNGIVLSFRSALRVAIMVPGEVRTGLDFKTLKTELTNKNIKATPSFRNTGNVSLDTDVRVTVDNLFGLQVAAAGGIFPILRDTTSQFNFELKRPFWGGWYKVGGNATYEAIQTADKKNARSAPIAITSAWLFVKPQPAALAVEIGSLLAVGAAATYIIWRVRRTRLLDRYAIIYKVQDDDDIETIAAHHDVSWKTLAKMNHLRPPYQLTVGQSLKVPTKTKPPAQTSR